MSINEEAGSTLQVTSSRPGSSAHRRSDSGGNPFSLARAAAAEAGSTPSNKHRATHSGLFGSGNRRRFGSSPTHRQNTLHGPRHVRYGWKGTGDSSNASAEDDGSPKLVSLSDLIRKEDTVPALYEHVVDTDAVMDARDVGGFPQQAMNGVSVGIQDALQAAEHGNSILLSKFLQDGGDPATVSRLHHMRWSLLHLAAGCGTIGGRLSSAAYRSRPEPDCTDGYATSVSELLAAGADPNVTSSVGGFTPLMSAALTGSKEISWLLLRAGAQLDRKSDDGRTAYDFALSAKYKGGGTSGDARGSVMAVLRDPPKKIPRSPTLVRATLAEYSNFEPEDTVPPVEVRWRAPNQASLTPTSVGDVERYYVKCWCRGKGKEAIMTKTSTADVPRRDFCRNQIIDRGIALRKNLCLPQSQTASAIVHGLQAGEIYSFTVSCVADVEGALRHSPPSCMSKPLLIPESKEDHNWPLGGMLSMVTGKESSSPSGPGETNGVQTQALRAAEQSPKVGDQSRGTSKGHTVTWAKDDMVPLEPSRQILRESITEDLDTSPKGAFGKQWNANTDVPSRHPSRRRSQSYASSVSRAEALLQAPLPKMSSYRSSYGGQGFNSYRSSPARGGRDVQGYQHAFGDATPTISPATRSARDLDESNQPLPASGRQNGRVRRSVHHDTYQDEGCNIS